MFIKSPSTIECENGLQSPSEIFQKFHFSLKAAAIFIASRSKLSGAYPKNTGTFGFSHRAKMGVYPLCPDN